MTIEIIYCRPCRYWGQALKDAGSLFEQFNPQIDAFQLTAGDDGIYEVKVDGKTIFSKDEHERFPEEGELVGLLREKQS